MASDIASEQVAMAEALAQNQGLNIEFQTASAENTQAPNQGLDVVTANQCFFVF